VQTAQRVEPTELPAPPSATPASLRLGAAAVPEPATAQTSSPTTVEDPRAFDLTTDVTFSTTPLPEQPAHVAPRAAGVRRWSSAVGGIARGWQLALPAVKGRWSAVRPAIARLRRTDWRGALPRIQTPNIRRVRRWLRSRRAAAGVAAAAIIGIGAVVVLVSGGAPSRDAVVAPKANPAVTAPASPRLGAAAVQPAVTPALTAIPVSTSSAPSCEELLGASFSKKLDPLAADAQTKLGKRQLVMGNVDASQRAFCNAAAWHSSNIDRLLNLAQLLLIRRDGAKAAQWAQRALDLDPHNRRALGVLGDALVRVGKTTEARAAWLGAEGTGEPDGAALALRIRRDFEEAQRTMLRVRDYARAERMFRRVVAFAPDHAAASAGVATCLLALGEKAEAETWALRAETLDANSADIQIALGDVEIQLGKRDDAERHWRRARELNPNDRVAEARIRRLGGS
jgi:tetratricopeptide (TPR) repeat protein